MFEVDTSVVVRLLTNDDKPQAARARRLIEQHDVLLPLTVLLDTEWVLRRVHGPRNHIIATPLEGEPRPAA